MLDNKVDAKVDVEISDDYLSAKLRITSPQGGNTANSTTIIEALNSKKS